ncbi:MAG TPA: RNA polymerase sigma factor [Planctomycetota bacterium]|jgi:RNA polymerase sigma-70 factor (ECF subfamily)|nr:RNA polymerase sigma factor [Planctomycetota bacterium]
MDGLVLTAPELADILRRLADLERETGLASLAVARARLEREGVDACRDSLDTVLMDVYRVTGSGAAFSLLYELNGRAFLASIVQRLRRIELPLDPGDVLQEVFFNVYRYPHRFHADREDAFRHWTHRIVKNTILKQWRARSRTARFEQSEEEIAERPDGPEVDPEREAMQRESEKACTFAYLVCLLHYLRAYRRLAPRERRALYLVEVKGVSYRDAAAEIGLRLENLKMVIFRARKKIFRSLEEALRGLCAAEGRPERGEERMG